MFDTCTQEYKNKDTHTSAHVHTPHTSHTHIHKHIQAQIPAGTSHPHDPFVGDVLETGYTLTVFSLAQVVFCNIITFYVHYRFIAIHYRFIASRFSCSLLLWFTYTIVL